MEIKQLEYVIMAADMGSFNKASEFLYTTQSNVSKVIRNLEKELGYAIFLRQGNGVLLTEAGNALYEQSRQIMKMLGTFKTFSNWQKRTCFHISCPVSNFLAWNFARFTNTMDSRQFCLKMHEGSMNDIVDDVVCGESELGFLYLGMKQEDSFQTLLTRKGLHFQKLLPAHIVVCVGPSHPCYEKAVLEEKDLAQLSFVQCKKNILSRAYHLLQVEKEFHLEKQMEDAVLVDSDYGLANMLLETDRAYLCYGVCHENRKTFLKNLREIPVKYHLEPIYLGYIYKKERTISPFAMKFIAQVEKVCPDDYAFLE